MKTIGFIGGGRITKIILQAFQNSKTTFNKILVYDTSQDVLKQLKELFPEIEIADNPDGAAGQDIIFIALHPPAIMETLGKIKGFFSREGWIISLAPKIPIKAIENGAQYGSSASSSDTECHLLYQSRLQSGFIFRSLFCSNEKGNDGFA
jgi:pyrroline-5-carboxylate reductase